MRQNRAWWAALLGLGIGVSACTLIASSGDITGNLEGAGSATSSGTGCGQGGGGNSGTSCADAIPVTLAAYGDIVTRCGSTAGAPAVTEPGGACAGAGKGPERIYAVTLAKSGFLTVSLNPHSTTFDSVLYLRSGPSCADAIGSAACADAPGNGGEVTSKFAARLPGDAGKDPTIFVFVDGKGQDDMGEYTISFSLERGSSCASRPVRIPVVPGLVATLQGDILNAGNEVQCGAGADVAYDFMPPLGMSGLSMTISVTPDFGGPMFLRAAGAGQCDEEDAGPSPAGCVAPDGGVTTTTTIQGEQLVWVDGLMAGGGQPYTMTVVVDDGGP
jgi:hypothetical protein